ncbi:TetR-like C-terminal domain-containing protein [Yeguia hominis]|uniref:TetR/AcrR family transcriptional regulator C-terminal domain-containing protein n=1 Tax=Yeguia hominis TaxID=2763662 RepID=A0A926DA19_9FIRM|nr:TetR-like C-terminal domain-containing protein [Yeguia hominis]MBC8534112.1 TetR/AcrR family transcriptional regulator C-terminal domain-containing protein [Yeguia hominis]
MEKRIHAAADQTKQALAAALKKWMAQKPMDKITIHDLTECCGIRRQNFYCHFADIYDLMRWMFQEEAVSTLRQHEGTLLWQEGLLQLFRYLEENRAVCLCALKSVGRDDLKRFFEADIHAIIHRTVEQISEAVGIARAGVTAEDIALMTHVYVVAFAGVLESWLLGEIERTPEELIVFADCFLQDHIRGAKIRMQYLGV